MHKALHNGTYSVMKYEHLMTEQDRDDLVRAASRVEEGKALRRRVFARLRARAFRQNGAQNK